MKNVLVIGGERSDLKLGDKAAVILKEIALVNRNMCSAWRHYKKKRKDDRQIDRQM